MKSYEPKHLTAEQVRGLASQSLPQTEAIVAQRWNDYILAVAALDALEVRAGVRPPVIDRSEEVVAEIRKAADRLASQDWRDMKRAEQTPAEPVLLNSNGDSTPC